MPSGQARPDLVAEYYGLPDRVRNRNRGHRPALLSFLRPGNSIRECTVAF